MLRLKCHRLGASFALPMGTISADLPRQDKKSQRAPSLPRRKCNTNEQKKQFYQLAETVSFDVVVLDDLEDDLPSPHGAKMGDVLKTKPHCLFKLAEPLNSIGRCDYGAAW
jgi:hypothetical protein